MAGVCNKEEVLAYNARVWSSSDGPETTWFTFNTLTGFITEIGSFDPPIQKYGENSKNYHGKRIFPGFHDAHTHLYWFSKCMSQLDVSECRSVKELQTKLENFAKDHPELDAILGQKMNQDILGRYPTKEELDEACSNKPVLIKRICCHVAVANSLLLKKIGNPFHQPFYFNSYIEVNQLNICFAWGPISSSPLLYQLTIVSLIFRY